MLDEADLGDCLRDGLVPRDDGDSGDTERDLAGGERAGRSAKTAVGTGFVFVFDEDLGAVAGVEV